MDVIFSPLVHGRILWTARLLLVVIQVSEG